MDGPLTYVVRIGPYRSARSRANPTVTGVSLEERLAITGAGLYARRVRVPSGIRSRPLGMLTRRPVSEGVTPLGSGRMRSRTTERSTRIVATLHGVLVKRTYQPKKRRRARKHGFRHRMSDRAGQAIIKARRRKGRHRLSA